MWRIKQQEPPPPGLDHPGTSKALTPRTGSSGAEQERAATTPGTGSSGEKWPDALGRMVQKGSSMRSPNPPDWRVQDKVAARSDGDMRPRPRRCSDGVMTGCSANDYAMEMQ